MFNEIHPTLQEEVCVSVLLKLLLSNDDVDFFGSHEQHSLKRSTSRIHGSRIHQQNPGSNPFALVFGLLRRHSHTELQPSTPSLRSPRPGVASGSLARRTRGRCQRRRNTTGRRNRRECCYPTCCRPCLHGAEHTALIPQN